MTGQGGGSRWRAWALRLFAAGALAGPALAGGPAADVIYEGAHILTMDPRQPSAEAVAVAGDRIVAVGDRRSVLKRRGPQTRMVALGERALLPGFIDAHGHITAQAAQVRMAALAPPPVGAVESIAALQDALRRYLSDRQPVPGQWVIGFGYDDSQLAERRHPTRADLDVVSTINPIYIIHASGHMGVANSPALAALDIGAATPDPPGGAIRRMPQSREPDGLLEESANSRVYAALPRLTSLGGGPAAPMDEAVAQLRIALMNNAAAGITTVEDGASLPENLAVLRAAAAADALPLDVIAHVLWAPLAGPLPALDDAGAYRGRLKIGGVKLILDGSPQGKTAFLSEPYRVPPPGKDAGYRGAPAMPQETVDAAVDTVLARGLQLQAHANGDAAAQQLIDAVARAQPAPADTGAPRVIMIHAQTVRDDQLDGMKALGIMPSFFPAHTFFWGDWHRDSVLGPVRAARISPMRSARERGMRFTIHNDAPVVPPDILRLVWNAVNRISRSGAVIGPEQRITVTEALAAVTRDAAFQNGEVRDKGTLAAGMQADLVILSEDPRAVPPLDLRRITVRETVSRGASVYRAD